MVFRGLFVVGRSALVRTKRRPAFSFFLAANEGPPWAVACCAQSMLGIPVQQHLVVRCYHRVEVGVGF